MDDPIIDCMKKLTMFHTPTFKPIMTHDELDPIMVRLGFKGRMLPPPSDGGGVAWREYVYGPCGTKGLVNGGGMMVPVSESVEEERRRWSEMRWPRLPWPRINGLHVWTYWVFVEDVRVFLERDDLSMIFHVRGMPLHKAHDRHKRFKRMGSEESFYVYREETLDRRTLESYNLCHYTKRDDDNCDDHNHRSNDADVGSQCDSSDLRNKGRDSSIGHFVPLRDMILWPPSCSSHL